MTEEFNFNLPQKRELLTVENIFKKVTELEIYRHFIGHDFEVGKAFLSPLRDEDNKSFGIYPTPGCKYKYHFKDFNSAFGNVLAFVCEYYKRPFNLLFAMYVINKEMNLNLDDVVVVISLKKSNISNSLLYSNNNISTDIIRYEKYQNNVEKINIEFRIRTRPAQKYDEDFWKKGCIKYDTLLLFNVFFTEEVWYRKGDLWMKLWQNSPINPIYSYYFPESNHYKHYRPFEKENQFGDKWKWLSNCNINDIQGYHVLPLKGNTLILTKSLKDVMTLYELGFNAISFHAEGVNIPESIMKELLDRFDNVICYYDNDEAGKKNSHKITKGYNIRHFNNPDNLKEKDAFDYVSSFGQKALLDLFASKGIYPDFKKIII